MNKVLQLALNPPKKDKSEIRGVMYNFRPDDKVMQVKNNYDIEWTKGMEKGTGIFNGDIGIILKAVKAESKIYIDFDVSPSIHMKCSISLSLHMLFRCTKVRAASLTR